MSDLFGNHIVDFPTRRLKSSYFLVNVRTHELARAYHGLTNIIKVTRGCLYNAMAWYAQLTLKELIIIKEPGSNIFMEILFILKSLTQTFAWKYHLY